MSCSEWTGLLIPLLAAAVGGCDSDSGSLSTDTGTTSPTASDSGSPKEPVQEVEPYPSTVIGGASVDILFVIDNSAYTGRFQNTLAQSIGALVDAVTSGEVAPDLHIAITTTDDGQHSCGPGESGSFVLSSCHTRLGNFDINTNGGSVSASDSCTSNCKHPELRIVPTTTADDPVPARRPWLEFGPSGTSLPPEISLTEALQCALPQGISGCGYEAPLESMKKSLQLAQTDGTEERGFLRDVATLAIIFFSEESDCSANDSLQEQWPTDEGSTHPDPSLCWDLGVECDWLASADQCVPANIAPDGSPAAPSESALHSVDSYSEMLGQIERAKKEADWDQEVLVAGILGVPEDYPVTRTIVYEDASAENPTDFGEDFGIEPGCSKEGRQAVPPVRMRAFAETFMLPDNRPNLFSVCSHDYSPALTAIGDAIRDQLRPGCMTTCVADADPSLDGLQPRCSVVETTPQGSETTEEAVPRCERAEDSTWVPPAGSSVCYVEHTSPQDMSPTCVEEGWNLEFTVVRAPGAVATPGSYVAATCEPSGNPALDCPGLPPSP